MSFKISRFWLEIFLRLCQSLCEDVVIRERSSRDAVNFKAMWSKWLIWDGFGLSLSSEIVQVRVLTFHYYETIKFYEKHLFVSLNFKKVEIFQLIVSRYFNISTVKDWRLLNHYKTFWKYVFLPIIVSSPYWRQNFFNVMHLPSKQVY